MSLIDDPCESAIDEARPAAEALLREMPPAALARIAKAFGESPAAGGTQCAMEMPPAAARLETREIAARWIKRPG